MPIFVSPTGPDALQVQISPSGPLRVLPTGPDSLPVMQLTGTTIITGFIAAQAGPATAFLGNIADLFQEAVESVVFAGDTDSLVLVDFLLRDVTVLLTVGVVVPVDLMVRTADLASVFAPTTLSDQRIREATDAAGDMSGEALVELAEVEVQAPGDTMESLTQVDQPMELEF